VEVFLGGGTPMGIRLSISPSVLISEGRIWIARKTIITASEVTGMVDVDFGYNISLWGAGAAMAALGGLPLFDAGLMRPSRRPEPPTASATNTTRRIA